MSPANRDNGTSFSLIRMPSTSSLAELSRLGRSVLRRLDVARGSVLVLFLVSQEKLPVCHQYGLLSVFRGGIPSTHILLSVLS